MKNLRRRQSLLSFLREIFIVLIGVLLALLINDWKERRNNETYLASVQSALRNDIQQSKKEVEKTLLRHQSALDSIGTYLDDDSRSVRAILEQAGGVQYPSTKNISFRFLVANKAELVDYQLIARLTDIELISELLDKKFDKLMDYVYEEMESTSRESKIVFATHLANVMDSEESLLNLYEQFLTEQQAAID